MEPIRRRGTEEQLDSLVLGLDVDAKTTYRMLALRYYWHPDKNDREITPSANRDQATAHFQILNMANSYRDQFCKCCFLRVQSVYGS